MDIRLHSGKAVTHLSRAPKGITTLTASKVLMVDLSRTNILIRTTIFEVEMQVIVETTVRTQTADSLALGDRLRIQILLPPRPGGEEGTSKIFSGLRVMQVLKIGAAVSIISNHLRGIYRVLPIRKQP